jgi:hypothetical protein
MTGIHFLRHYETWVQTQLLILQQRYREAHELIGSHLAQWQACGPQRYRVQAEADALLCRAALGLALAPGEVDAWGANADLGRSDPDDAALVYLALADALDRLGEAARSAHMRERARAAYGQHLELAAGLLADLNRVGLNPREWDDLYGAA